MHDPGEAENREPDFANLDYISKGTFLRFQNHRKRSAVGYHKLNGIVLPDIKRVNKAVLDGAFNFTVVRK